MCTWRPMTKEEMVQKVCEMYEKNGIHYTLEVVRQLNEEQLKDEMAEYMEI